jgi:hypothetical protein
MNRRKFAQVSFVVALALWLSAFGCPKDPYRASIKASDDVSQAVSKAIPFIGEYYTAGKLTDEEKANAAGYLTLVTTGNQTFRKNVNAAHAAGATGPAAYVAIAQAFVNSVPTDPLAFRYKSVDAQNKFKEVLGAVKSILDGIVLVIQNSKAGG